MEKESNQVYIYIQKILKAQGRTKKWASKFLGIHENTFYRYAENDMPFSHVAKLAIELGFNLENLKQFFIEK